DGDHLKIGPLVFAVRVEAGVPVDSPTPMPPTKESKVVGADEAAATVLLSPLEEGTPGASSSKVDSEGVPTGSTMTEASQPQTPAQPSDLPSREMGQSQLPVDEMPAGDTASAAKTILDKYLRRPRK